MPACGLTGVQGLGDSATYRPVMPCLVDYGGRMAANFRSLDAECLSRLRAGEEILEAAHFA